MKAFFPSLVEQNIFAIAGEDLSAPAKILKEHLKSESKPTFKAAIIDGIFMVKIPLMH